MMIPTDFLISMAQKDISMAEKGQTLILLNLELL